MRAGAKGHAWVKMCIRDSILCGKKKATQEIVVLPKKKPLRKAERQKEKAWFILDCMQKPTYLIGPYS